MNKIKMRKYLDKYVHELHLATDLQGRWGNFTQLNCWAEAENARIIVINGIGGQGKSTLVGHWLKKERTPQLAKRPVFYWSFYESVDLSEFDWELLDFCQQLLRKIGKKEESGQFPLIKTAQEIPLILVLDGLEKLQRKTEDSQRVLESSLQFMLNTWMRYQHQGLMVITSRFSLPHLNQTAGVYNLHLMPLSPSEGSTLLQHLGVKGRYNLLADYSARFHGHPLTLKVLAGIVNQYCNGDLEQLAAKHIISVDAHERLDDSLKDLLGFYAHQFHNGQRELLGIISLFKQPLEVTALLELLRGMESIHNTPLAGLDEANVVREINELVADYLVEMVGKDKVMCHPLIQGYFRREFHLHGCRKEVAGFLQRRLQATHPRNLEEVRDLVNAVQLLCDEEDFPAAHQLCQNRLLEGGYGLDVFNHLTAIPEGLQCCLAFVGNEERQKKTEAVLGKAVTAVYISSISLYNMKLGNISQAREWLFKGLDLCNSLQNQRQQVFTLQEVNNLEQALGNIRQAQKLFSQDK